MLTLSQDDEIEVISGFHSDGFHDQFVLLVCQLTEFFLSNQYLGMKERSQLHWGETAADRGAASCNCEFLFRVMETVA